MDEEFLLPSQRRRMQAPVEEPAPAASSTPPKGEEPAFVLPSQVRNAPDYKKMGWGEAAGIGLTNFAPSAWKVAKETASAFAPENIPDTALGLGNLAYGAVSKGMTALGIPQNPEEKKQHEATIDALMTHYKDKYSDPEAIKKAVAENPADILADIASVATLTPQSLSRVPGVLGKTAGAVRTAGELATPIAGPVKAAGTVIGAVSPLANQGLAKLAGVSVRSMEDAAKAGMSSDPSFWRALSGEITPHDIIGDVESALSKVAKERSEAYVEGMSDLSKTAKLPFDPIDKAVDTIDKMAFSGPAKLEKNRAAATAAQEIRDTVAAWKNAAANEPYYQTVQGFDELKQAIANIAKTYRGTPADKAVGDVAKAVKREIERIDPQYAEIMDKYGSMSDELNELRKELLTGNKGTTGAGLRKLLKAQNDKYRAELIDELARRDPSLPAKISGMEVAQAHGHAAGAAGFGSLLSLLLSDPKLLGPTVAGAALSTPSLAAKTAAGVKQATAPFEFAGRKAGELSPVIGLSRANQEAGLRPFRKSGGRVTADRLMGMVRTSRKKIQSQTASILNQPDEHVVHALKVANQHI